MFHKDKQNYASICLSVFLWIKYTLLYSTMIFQFQHIFNIYMYSQTCPCGNLYQAVTCIERSPFSCPVIENFIWIEPLLKGHLSYKTTFTLSQRWPPNTGLTIIFFNFLSPHRPNYTVKPAWVTTSIKQ